MNWRPRKRVYKLPNGKTRTVWVARYEDQHGNVKIAKPNWNGGKGTFDLRREAQRAIDEAITARIPARTSSVGGYLPRWLETRPRSARTDRTNQGRIRAVLKVELECVPLEDWDMRDLRRRHRDELVAGMLIDHGRSPGGARNILRALSAMFEDAITDELADVNPWQGAKVRDDDRRASKRARELRVWSFEEMHEFARFGGRYEPMIRTLADCGLRIGEVFALKRADLDGSVLHVRGSAWEGKVVDSSHFKNHDRDMPIPAGTLAIVRAMPTRIGCEWLFPTPTGKLWRYSNWHRKVWQPTIEAASKNGRGRKLDPTPHEMRHSWITHLRAAGVDPADLADMAGHSVYTATSRYTHALRKSFDEVRRLVG